MSLNHQKSLDFDKQARIPTSEEDTKHWILHELTYPSKEEVQPPTLKERIWTLFEDPTSGTIAYILSISIMCMILVSGVAFLIETIPGNSIYDNQSMKLLEYFFVICFTIEYLCRLCSCPDKKAFMLSFLNSIDLLAFLPFYIEFVMRKQ
eukprot:64733_1